MSKRLGIVWSYLAHYKYLIVVVLGILIVGVIDENSVRQHIRYQMQISNLRSEIEKYNREYCKDSKQLKEMRQSAKAYERIARERYFMKADDEDIFVLSTDMPATNEQEDNNETVE